MREQKYESNFVFPSWRSFVLRRQEGDTHKSHELVAMKLQKICSNINGRRGYR